jgi:Protein of unknown function (DUF2845)
MRLPQLVLAFSLLTPLTSRADSFRCGTTIVPEDSSKVETLAKCGEPVSRETRTVIESFRTKAEGGEPEVSHEVTVVRTIEEWTYNFGPNSFLRVVTFIDGKLRHVRTGAYGF